jgi:hypothetical protein
VENKIKVLIEIASPLILCDAWQAYSEAQNFRFAAAFIPPALSRNFCPLKSNGIGVFFCFVL